MFREALRETLKVTEDALGGAMSQVKYEEKPQDASVEEKPVEITQELVDGLIKKIPELEGIDPIKLLAGIQVEMEHAKSVGNNIEMVAKIAADHLKEFAAGDYYAALATMEAGLVPAAPVEAVPPVEGEVKVEVTAEEAPAEEEDEDEDDEDEDDDEDYEEDENDSIEEAKSKKEKRDAKKAKKDAKQAKKDAKKAKKDKAAKKDK